MLSYLWRWIGSGFRSASEPSPATPQESPAAVVPSPEEAPPPSLTRSALLAEDEVPAADTEQPEGSIEATQAAML